MSGGSKHNENEQETIEVDGFDELGSDVHSEESLEVHKRFFTLPEVHQMHDSREVMSAIPFASNRYQIQNQIGEGGMSEVFGYLTKY